MMERFGWLFSSSGFMPHGHCYSWQPATLWLNVTSDALIAAAYYVIPAALYHFVRQQRAAHPYAGIFLMFAAFILLCGTTHVMEIWTVWNPEYRLAGALKLVTGIVSVATTLAIFKVMPQAMLLRSPTQLRHEVELRTAELAQVNAKLRDEISARDLAQRQLREQDRRKDEFLATLAHELRNPLAPIRHAVKLLGIASVDDRQQHWGREVIARQAERMALLLDDLLDVSRITRGRLPLKIGRADLATLVNTAVDTVRPTLDDKQQTLALHLPVEPVDIEVDALRLSQALSNLLTNAAKFTGRGGSITLSAAATADGVTIAVGDNGIGFEPASVPNLFEMFSQAGGAIKGAEGGLGIGLSLVKGLIELHGGSVAAHSDGPGAGSVFTILLPPSVVPVATAPSPSAEPQRGIAPQTKILIADDNRDAAESMGMLLQLSGHEVLVAHCGREALELGQRHQPDFIILDIGMPDLSGYEVARAIRTEAWGRKAFMVAMTGWGQAADKEKARAAGFDRHLTKPVNPDMVEELLASFRTSKPSLLDTTNGGA